MNKFFKCASVTLLLFAPLTSLAQVACPKPVIPESQKLDPKLVQYQPKDTADLPSVIASVKAALQCYQDNRGTGTDALPALSSVVFDFKTTTGTVGGLSFSIFIVKIGGSIEKDSGNEVSFTYSLPTPAPTRGLHKKNPEQLSDALANEILAAAKTAQTSQSFLNLPLSKVAITIQYGIKIDGNASLNLPVTLVTLGPNADRNKVSTQSIAVTFGH
jgi:hypothetical protein